MNMTVRTIKTDAQTYSPAQKEQAQKCNVPIYLYPGAYAQRHGEIEEYRASRQANIACRDAIDAAIREHFRDNVLSKKAVQSVIGQYGFDRTMYVLAVTVLDRATGIGQRCSRFSLILMTGAMKETERLLCALIRG